MKSKAYLPIVFALTAATVVDSFELRSSMLTGEGSGEVVAYASGTLAYTNNPSGGVSLVQIGSDFSYNDPVNINFSAYSYNDGFVFESVTSVSYELGGLGLPLFKAQTVRKGV